MIFNSIFQVLLSIYSRLRWAFWVGLGLVTWTMWILQPYSCEIDLLNKNKRSIQLFSLNIVALVSLMAYDLCTCGFQRNTHPCTDCNCKTRIYRFLSEGVGGFGYVLIKRGNWCMYVFLEKSYQMIWRQNLSKSLGVLFLEFASAMPVHRDMKKKRKKNWLINTLHMACDLIRCLYTFQVMMWRKRSLILQSI